MMMRIHRTPMTTRREKCVAWTWLTRGDAVLGMSDALFTCLPPASAYRHTRTNWRAGGQMELLGLHCLLFSAFVPVTSWTFSPVCEGMCLVVACLCLRAPVDVWDHCVCVCSIESLLNVCEILWDLCLYDWVSLWPATYPKGIVQPKMENVILSHVEYKSNMYFIVNAINVLFWISVVWTKKYALKFLESKEFGTDFILGELSL